MNLFNTNTTTTYPLRRALFAKYGYPDKRTKKIESMSKFRVDLEQHRVGADGQPLGGVCSIFVDALNETMFTTAKSVVLTVTLAHTVPAGETIETWMRSNGVRDGSTTPMRGLLSIHLAGTDIDKLLGLADAIRAERRQSPSDYYSYPRTADALVALHQCLSLAMS
jgi:hypothetical protein